MEIRGALRAAHGMLVAAGLALAAPAAGQGLDAEASEALVRAVWYEGLPFAEAVSVGPDGAAALAELLADPTESAVHANALLALGISGRPGAYEAIAAWARQPRRGELERGAFRAWQALPHALGHLARHDSRALDLLAEQLAGPAVAWRFRHFDAPRLRRMARRGAASGLAGSGLPRARALLAGARHAGGADWRSHVDEALALHARVARHGAAVVFGRDARGAPE